MSIISQILDIFFAPITICIKFIKQDAKDHDQGFYAFLAIVCWLILAFVSGLAVAPAVSTTFLLTSFFLGYFFSIYFSFKISEIGKEDEIIRFIFYIVTGIISGYTFGLMAYLFLLL